MRRDIRERRHRLPLSNYKGIRIVSFTACVRDRAPLFTSTNVVDACSLHLMDALERHQSDALLYLFMPDHAHILLRGNSDQADVRKAMVRFKYLSGCWLDSTTSPYRWQKDFYDHILRHDDDVIRHMRYIVNNPVRAGIVERWKDYPYKGSTVYNLDEWDEVVG